MSWRINGGERQSGVLAVVDMSAVPHCSKPPFELFMQAAHSGTKQQ